MPSEIRSSMNEISESESQALITKGGIDSIYQKHQIISGTLTC